MTQNIFGNTHGLSPSEIKKLNKLFERRLNNSEILSNEIGREICEVANDLGKIVAVLINRDGLVEEVIVGKRDIVYLPNLKRFRESKARLKGIRLIFSDLTKTQEKVSIPSDIYTDLQKLRLDLVCAVKLINNQLVLSYAWNKPVVSPEDNPIEAIKNVQVDSVKFNFNEWILELENELIKNSPKAIKTDQIKAMIIGIYPKNIKNHQDSINELKELARTANINIADQVIQIRDPDPKTYVGKGKLEEIILRAIRFDIEMLIFDSELSPTQWRSIVNSSELKVIDRSMLILDIFAQNAKTHDGKLQVELAQLKYNLPKLIEKDTGMSRLTGGIGGRGPGETKLELNRRNFRDKISALEKEIDKLSKQRALRRKKRESIPVPLVALVGYTNVGKSCLFNAITHSQVLVENKLFATLDPTQRRLFLKTADDYTQYAKSQVILIDTVGFIRELPKELVNAFRATLEEINHSNILLHILDASDPEISLRYNSVVKQLNDFGMGNISRINILNKCDLINEDQSLELQKTFNAIAVSAHKKQGFDLIVKQITSMLENNEHLVYN